MSVIDFRETTETPYESPNESPYETTQERYEPESPFSEGPVSENTEHLDAAAGAGFLPWAEASTPFAEAVSSLAGGDANEALLAEAMEQLYDEGFEESLADLVSETEAAIGERVSDEVGSGSGAERETVGEAHLAPLTFEAHRYLENLANGLATVDVASLDEQQLDEVLERFDPTPGGLTPAGEEFLGGLIRKAKNAVKWVAKTAGSVGKAVTGVLGGVLGGVLKKLYGLVKPLLRRVLGMAIGRLPTPLQPLARKLAQKIGLEATETGETNESGATAALAADPESLSEQFDAVVAETMAVPGEAQTELESFGGDTESESAPDGRELEQLALARADLIDTLASAQEGENLGPAVEQFVPALLGALRLGINIVGRPKVVNFLAGYLSQLIGKWVGPSMAGPLSNAIVDTGLRLITLEAETTEAERDNPAAAMLAATVEDTVRHLAQSESYVFEDEALLQDAVSEAFQRAVATNFPARFVRPRLQPAPSLGGSFLQRGMRTTSPFRKYNRTPEVTVSEQMAESIRSFGGVSLAASLRAHGYQLPVRARVHIYEATVGTALMKLVRRDRTAPGLATGRRPWTRLHPLTPEAAATLLQEPRLGVQVPSVYLHSRHRVAAGQRFYYLEPITSAGTLLPVAAAGPRALPGAPTQGWVTIDLVRSKVVVDLFFSESEAQQIAAASKTGGAAEVLKAMRSAWTSLARSFDHPSGRVRIIKEMEEGEQLLGPLLRRMPPVVVQLLRRHLQEWVMRSLAKWVRTSVHEFVRAAADPADGVTVRITLRGLPGLDVVRQVINGKFSIASVGALGPLGAARGTSAMRGAPQVSVRVRPGRRRA